MEFTADCAICNVADKAKPTKAESKLERYKFDSSLKALLWLANHCVTWHGHGDTIVFHGFVSRTKK